MAHMKIWAIFLFNEFCFRDLSLQVISILFLKKIFFIGLMEFHA